MSSTDIMQQNGVAEVADGLIASALRRAGPTWPTGQIPGLTDEVLRRAIYHGAAALLHEVAETLTSWPATLLTDLREHAIARAFWELRHQHVISTAVAALARAAIVPVIFKGTAVAYSTYANPNCRERADTDMIVPPEQTDDAARVLESLGFTRVAAAGGEVASYQSNYVLGAHDGSGHTIDLHRRINNSELLSKVLSYDELHANSVAAPLLCPGARIAGHVHALLLACLHPATHRNNPYHVDGIAYFGGERLIWLYDIDLLAGTMVSSDWQSLVDLARSKGLCEITHDSLLAASRILGTEPPPAVVASLHRSGEPISDYLRAGPFRQGCIDLAAIPEFGRKLQFVREHLFPSAEYMLTKYQAPAHTLPWLYMRRAAEGLIKRTAARDGER